MPSWQEEKVIEDLGPMLRAAGLHTQILAYDHNWSEHPNDIASTPPDETADINDYPQKVLTSPAARWISGVAYHCYYGDPSAMTALHNQFPDKAIYFTECSGSQSADPANTFSDTLKWHARNLMIGCHPQLGRDRHQLEPGPRPHRRARTSGGCGTCTGIVTVGPGDTVTHNAEYYALGHLARFVQPGAVRIASTSFGTTGWNGAGHGRRVPQPGRLAPCWSRTTRTTTRRPSPCSEGDQPSPTLCPAARWPPSSGPVASPGTDALRQVAPAGWTATANPPGPTDPCCTGDVAANAVDGDASTRYSTGAGQAPGQYLQVDFGKRDPGPAGRLRHRRVHRRLPARLRRDDQHRRRRTGSPVAAGHGTGPVHHRRPAGAPVRYVRITLTAASGNWWSVADVRAYTGGL